MKPVPPGKKNMSVLLCARTNGLAREVGDGVTRFGLQLLPRGGRRRRPRHSGGRRGCPVSSHDLGPSERAPRGARERVPAPQPGKPLGRGAQATPPPSTCAGPAAPGPVGTPGSPNTTGPGRGLAWAGFASLGPRKTGPPSGWLALSGASRRAQVTGPGGPWRGPPPSESVGGQRPYQGPGRALGVGGAGGASGTLREPPAPQGERASCARSGLRPLGPGLRRCGPARHPGTQGPGWHMGGSWEHTGKALSGRPRRGPSKASDGGAALPTARPRA